MVSICGGFQIICFIVCDTHAHLIIMNLLVSAYTAEQIKTSLCLRCFGASLCEYLVLVTYGYSELEMIVSML